MKSLTNLSLLGMCSLLGAGVTMAHDQDAERTFDLLHNAEKETPLGHLHLSYESRYISEGRDNLDGDALLTTSAEFSLGAVSTGVWYGVSPEQRYEELQLSLGLTREWGDWSGYVTYTYLETLVDHQHDNEIGLGVAWAGLPAGVEATLDAYYSFDADGWFGELGLNREFELSQKWNISLSGVLGINQGYIADGHDGVNHVAALVETHYQLNDSITLDIHAGYTWAIDRDKDLEGDANLLDKFHVGVGLQWEF